MKVTYLKKYFFSDITTIKIFACLGTINPHFKLPFQIIPKGKHAKMALLLFGLLFFAVLQESVLKHRGRDSPTGASLGPVKASYTEYSGRYRPYLCCQNILSQAVS